MSDPSLSDIDFENKMAWVWTTLKTNQIENFYRWFKSIVGAIGSTRSLNSIIKSSESSIVSSTGINDPSLIVSFFSSIIISLSDSTSTRLSRISFVSSTKTFEFEEWLNSPIDPFSIEPNKGWESGPRLLLGSSLFSWISFPDDVIIFCECFCDCEKC